MSGENENEDTLGPDVVLKVKLDEYKVVGEDNDSPNVVLQLNVKVKFGGYNDLPNVVLELRLDEDNGSPDDVLVSRQRREDENDNFAFTTTALPVGSF